MRHLVLTPNYHKYYLIYHFPLRTMTNLTKDELLEILSKIDGNPEIVLWNGFVSDYQHVDDVRGATLVKQSFAKYCRSIENERIVDKTDINYRIPNGEIAELRENWESHQWELDPYVTEAEISSGAYESRLVLVITAKSRDLIGFDRIGGFKY